MSEPDAHADTPRARSVITGHERHCFVVMPSGREPAEQKWFRGWFEVVIHPAVKEAGYDPILAAAEEQPGAINDEIRSHLAVDPMVVVDLGGAEPEDDPNPNVMYELGIRHALGLPLVMMAWKGQRLPFDVGNQRVIMEDRDLVDLDLNRKKLVSFIRAAEQGKFYRPMEAVSRVATIEVASQSLGEDSLLRALAQEVSALRSTLGSLAKPRGSRFGTAPQLNVRRLISHKAFRKELYAHFTESGGIQKDLPRLLKMVLSAEDFERMQSWGQQEWKAFVSNHAERMASQSAAQQAAALPVADAQTPSLVSPIDYEDPDLLEKVRSSLPAQPWPDGIHRRVAESLGVPDRVVSRCITVLIGRGDFLRQVDGELSPAESEGA